MGGRARPLEWYGIILGIAGMAVINFDAGLAGDPRGVFLVIAACLSWALASALIPRLDLPTGAMSSAVQMLAGGAVSLPIALVSGEHLSLHPDSKAVAALAYLVVFGSIVAYSSFVWLLRNVRPALATSSSYVNPVVALFLGWLIAHESIGWHLIAGIAIILTGVVLISRANRR
jgi:drug/metabolite transporter (DMT)-like permease